jgi:glycerol-3-phosphate dehydrogenase
MAELRRDYPFLAADTAERLAQSYGSGARQILGEARRMADLGRDFGHGFSEAELAWLVEREWAATAEDVLWRRSKLGLVMTPSEAQEIAAYLARVTHGSGSPAAAASAPAGQTAYR